MASLALHQKSDDILQVVNAIQQVVIIIGVLFSILYKWSTFEASSLADVTYAAGTFVRPRQLAERDVIALAAYPNVVAWIERIEAGKS